MDGGLVSDIDDLMNDPYVAIRVRRIAQQKCDAVLADAASAVLRRLMPEMPAGKQGKAKWRRPVRAEVL